MCSLPSKETVLQRVPLVLVPLQVVREPLMEFFAAWSLRLRQERVGVDDPVIEGYEKSKESSGKAVVENGDWMMGRWFKVEKDQSKLTLFRLNKQRSGRTRIGLPTVSEFLLCQPPDSVDQKSKSDNKNLNLIQPSTRLRDGSSTGARFVTISPKLALRQQKVDANAARS